MRPARGPQTPRRSAGPTHRARERPCTGSPGRASELRWRASSPGRPVAAAGDVPARRPPPEPEAERRARSATPRGPQRRPRAGRPTATAAGAARHRTDRPVRARTRLGSGHSPDRADQGPPRWDNARARNGGRAPRPRMPAPPARHASREPWRTAAAPAACLSSARGARRGPPEAPLRGARRDEKRPPATAPAEEGPGATRRATGARSTEGWCLDRQAWGVGSKPAPQPSSLAHQCRRDRA
jgi:hypothetical protein